MCISYVTPVTELLWSTNSVLGPGREKRKKPLGLIFVHFDPMMFFRLINTRKVFISVHLAVDISLTLPLRFLYLNFSRLIIEPLEGKKLSSSLLSRTVKN